MWMCAAPAAPVSFENLSRQAIVPARTELRDRGGEAARRTTDVSFGLRHLLPRREVRRDARRRCELTANLARTIRRRVDVDVGGPPSIASSTASVRLPVPLSGLWHRQHSASTTGPGEPGAPVWM